MAAIICYSQTNFKPTGQGKTYTENQKDLTKDFPNGIHSAEVLNNPITVFQEINFQPPPGKVLAVGKYPNQSQFPAPGGAGFKSLQVQ